MTTSTPISRNFALLPAKDLVEHFNELSSGVCGPVEPTDPAWPLEDARGWTYAAAATNGDVVTYQLHDRDSSTKASYMCRPTDVVAVNMANWYVPGSNSPAPSVPQALPRYKVSVEPLTIFGKVVAWRSDVRHLVHLDGRDRYILLLFGRNYSFTRKGIERSFQGTIRRHIRENEPPEAHELAETIYVP